MKLLHGMYLYFSCLFSVPGLVSSYRHILLHQIHAFCLPYTRARTTPIFSPFLALGKYTMVYFVQSKEDVQSEKSVTSRMMQGFGGRGKPAKINIEKLRIEMYVRTLHPGKITGSFTLLHSATKPRYHKIPFHPLLIWA